MKVSQIRRRWCLVAASLFAFAGCSDSTEPPPPTGSLTLNVTGLNDTIPADITLSGPNGYSTRVTATQTFSALTPGTYTIAARQVRTNAATFSPSFESVTVTVGANGAGSATVIYSVTTGRLTITVAGAPPDVPWKVHVTGPAGYRDSVSASSTLGNLVPGPYAVSASELRKGPSIYAPKPAEFVVTVPASLTPASGVVAYALITGSLSLHVNGLPGGVTGSVSLTGPGGFTTTAGTSTLFEGLVHGRYDVSAAPVGGQYSASPATQSVTIVQGAVGLVNVNYWSGAQAGLNLAVDAVQLQQVVQTYGGGVPSVAGREALLRVFVRASQPNAAAPDVRVRLYDGLVLVTTQVIPAPSAGVPTTTDEGQLSSSWNVAIPASVMKPGLRVLVDVDPANAIAESLESDNTWPSSGSPLVLDVRTVPPLSVALVPVTQTSTGLTGDISTATLPLYADAASRMLPVNQLTFTIHAPYTTSAPPLQPNDANAAWVQILNELRALWAAEGSPGHYYGIVKVPYTSGVIGLSYLPSFVAVGYDLLPNAAPTMVHELGHNFGRFHAPSCGAGSLDADYPYPQGAIGVYGYDAVSLALVTPLAPDIMGYCTQRWISDYTYAGIFAYRSALPAVVARAAAQPGLLVWGRISSDGLVLEPAFDVTAPARLPTFGGPHRVDVLDESGKVLTSLSFRGDRAVDGPRDDETFAFVIPARLFGAASPARLRLSSAGRRAELATTGFEPGDFAPTVVRSSASRVRVLWRHAVGRGVMVRDALTGQILALARGGHADVFTGAQSVDLILSDGVRSARRSVLVR